MLLKPKLPYLFFFTTSAAVIKPQLLFTSCFSCSFGPSVGFAADRVWFLDATGEKGTI